MENCETVIVTITTTEPSGGGSEIQIPLGATVTEQHFKLETHDHQTNPLEIHESHLPIAVQHQITDSSGGGGVGGVGPEKPFQCNVCERRFRQLSTLTNHVKIHTGEKPYRCTICDKAFRQSSTLTNHMKIHTGEKPFACTYCGKQFRQLSTLTNHLKIHTGEKPFECAVCKKQFRQSSTLNNHIKIHVMDKLYIPFEIKTEEEEG